jgi:hypothetical protein
MPNSAKMTFHQQVGIGPSDSGSGSSPIILVFDWRSVDPLVASTQGWKAMTRGPELESRVFVPEKRG